MNNGPLSTIILIAIICNVALMSFIVLPLIRRRRAAPRREIVDPDRVRHGAVGATAPD